MKKNSDKNLPSRKGRPGQGFIYSIGFNFVLIILIAFIPIASWNLYTYKIDRDAAVQDASAHSMEIVRLAASAQETLIDGSRQLLIALSSVPEVRDWEDIACDRFLLDLLNKNNQFANFGVADKDGDVICSAQSMNKGANIAEQTFFQQAIDRSEFAIGEYQPDQPGSAESLNFGYPVLKADGKSSGVIYAAIDLVWLNQLLSKTEFPAETSATIINNEGVIIARYPDPEIWLGKNLIQNSLIKTILSRTSGVTLQEGLDGTMRFNAFVQLYDDNSGLYIIIGIPSQPIFAQIQHKLNKNFIVLGLIAALTMISLYILGELLILRRIRHISNVATRLASGNLGARSGMDNSFGEINQLGFTIDRMADTLQKNESQLQQSYKETNERAQQLELLYDAGIHLNSQLDHRHQLRFLFETAMKSINAQRAEFFRFIPEREKLLFELGLGYHSRNGENLKRMEFFVGESEGVIGKVAQTGCMYVIPDLDNYPHQMPIDPELKTGLFSPIEHKGNLLGVLALYSIQPEAFDTQHEKWIGLFSNQAAVAMTNAGLMNEISQRLEQIEGLHEIDRAISSSFDLRVTSNVVIDQIMKNLHVDAADILQVMPETQTLVFVTSRGFRTKALQYTSLRIGESLAGWAAQERISVHIPDLALEEYRFSHSPYYAKEGFVSYFAIPLIAKGKVKGVLEIFHREQFIPDQDWLDFAEILAGQAAIALDNVSMFNDVTDANIDLTLAYDKTIEGWAVALDLRDRETEGHTRRVTELTMRLAKEMYIRESELAHIRRGALLHDIGKMGIPDSILQKPGKLTDEERETMMKHPFYAYRMLSSISYLRTALEIPYCHHEKWDGSGYPRGLKGEQIPLSARIFAVVDVWDALTSDRPYRKAWSKLKAMLYIRKQAGSHFDPGVVDKFIQLDLS